VAPGAGEYPDRVAVTTVAVAGSTGSIGTQTIDVVRAEPDRFEVVALGAWSSVDQLVTQARDLQLVEPATELILTYRLSGSTVRSIPSEAGRASAALSPLTAGTDGTLPTNIVVSGGGLLNVVCPQLTETRCAVGEPPRMGVQRGIPADRALAVLQLNLPMQP
jgi:hypothetical protein